MTGNTDLKRFQLHERISTIASAFSRYEIAVQHRNDRGVQLVEREEEVCIFYEKSNIQDIMISNGDVGVRALEEEIRYVEGTLQQRKLKKILLTISSCMYVVNPIKFEALLKYSL